MALFSRKIICLNCDGRFKGKLERGNRVYLCSNYDNYGNCKREVLHESLLIELLVRRYGKNFEVAKDNIQNTVIDIEVEHKWKFKINLKNDKPIIFDDDFVQF